MRIRTLGPLEVADDGGLVDIGGPRQQRVLACLLAAAPEFVTVDRLIDEVWGDGAPATATHVISTYVSNLRKVFGQQIISVAQRHAMNLTSDEVDAVEFVEGVELGRSLLDSDPARALAALDGALDMWNGRPFGNLADDSPLLQRRADELIEVRMQAIEARLGAALDLGHHERIVPELRALTAEHPWRERLWQRLMLALYRGGRQAEALRAGLELRAILRDQLGIDPLPDTRDLEERILLQDPGLEFLPPTNLPAFSSSFVGRTQELGEIAKLLDTDRLVTLVGVGGVGKTRLAVQAGRLLLDGFVDGVWWVDLASASADTSIPRRVAEVFGLADQPGADPITLVSRFLARKQTLLVLDNCEHVVDSVVELATTLLEGAASLTILATSRRPLGVGGETRYQVPSMTVPLTELGLSDAERLFHDRAARVDSGFTATAANASDVARICRDLDGLPLAIEMAAARVNLLTPGQIAGYLDERFQFLNTVSGTSHERHASLAAAFDWSYNLLSPEHQLLFDRLGVFEGPFDMVACQGVAAGSDMTAGSVVAGLGALVDASMVVAMRSDGSMRYRLLDTLRIYGRARLKARLESDAAAERHCRYFLGLAEESGWARMTPSHSASVTVLDRSNDDLLAALDWSLDNEERSVTLAAAPGLAQYWNRRGDPATALRYGKRMLAGVEMTDPDLRAAAGTCVAFGAMMIGDLETAMSAMGDVMRLMEDGRDWKTLLWVLNVRGTSALFAGNPRGAKEAGTRILDVCSDIDVTLPRAYGLALLGQGEFFADGDLDRARGYFEEAVALFRVLGDEAALNISGLVFLSAITGLQGDYETAERYGVEATTLGGPGWSAAALVLLAAHALHPMGELDRAERVLARGLTMAHERSIEIWARTALLMLGRIAADREQWERAARLHGASRRNLPGWMSHPRWWEAEARTREALGEEAFETIAASGESETLNHLVLRAINEIRT